ncbi:two-component system response regulator [Shewanella intestini]|uniref:Response regulator n=1 Tax=Shewanella intestini TaxID=2017544 RepID=A0ABS5HZG1_9GAMM|nr:MULTISPECIES: response regulator [Shewanella]MBR9726963.1 response regulator [Shewanella intestini]MRG34471.1 response regulator [Shewanella sp. XMDDZSB0408]
MNNPPLPSIVVIDDEICLLEAYEMALSDTKVNLLTTADSQTGIDLICQHQPILAFIDLKMPTLNGVEVVQQLFKKGIRTKIYIVSAYVEEYLKDLDVLKQQHIPFEIAIKPLYPKEIRQIVQAQVELETVCTAVDIQHGEQKSFCHGMDITLIGLFQKAKEFELNLQECLEHSQIENSKLTVIEVSSLPVKDKYRDVFNGSELMGYLPQTLIGLIGEVYQRNDLMLIVQLHSSNKFAFAV